MPFSDVYLRVGTTEHIEIFSPEGVSMGSNFRVLKSFADADDFTSGWPNTGAALFLVEEGACEHCSRLIKVTIGFHKGMLAISTVASTREEMESFSNAPSLASLDGVKKSGIESKDSTH